MTASSPAPYLDPIVTRRRSGTGISGGARPPPWSATILSANVAQKGGLETIAEKRSCALSRSAGFTTNRAAERLNWQKRKAMSADLSKTENQELAYLVVNLQSNLLRENSAPAAGEYKL